MSIVQYNLCQNYVTYFKTYVHGIKMNNTKTADNTTNHTINVSLEYLFAGVGSLIMTTPPPSLPGAPCRKAG